MVAKCTADFELRYADGTPLRMGWGAVIRARSSCNSCPAPSSMVLGDAVNLGFRISSIAGREGRPSILATESVREAADGQFTFGDPETVTVKGRVGIETIYGVFPP